MLYANLDERLRVYWGDAVECLEEIAPASVQTVVTSPPYFGLRDYGTGKWDGGDPACRHGVPAQTSQPKNATSTIAGSTKQDDTAPRFRERCGLCGAVRLDQQVGIETTLDGYVDRLVEVFESARRALRPDGALWLNLGDMYASDPGKGSSGNGKEHVYLGETSQTRRPIPAGVKAKDLIGAPWEVALALRAAGWHLRSCVVWDKSNGMPESAKDRPTDSHEYVFLMSPNPAYRFRHFGEVHVRSVWRGPTAGYKGDHVAVMPLWLAQRCVLLTSRSGDIVLDPFAGSGTTLVAALGYGRRAVGIDLLADNCGQQLRRVNEEVLKPSAAAAV